jgi:hypothetical protein
MKNFNDYRRIKSQYGSITEQQFLGDSGEEFEMPMDETPINIDTKIPLEVKEVPKKIEAPKEEGDATIDSNITKLLNFLSQVKVFHWNTNEYPAHKASRSILRIFDEALDTFVETYQGYYPRVKFVDGLHIRNIEDLVVNEWLDDTEATIGSIRAKVTQSDLQNILDELSAIIGKFKYLLTLK